MSNAKISALTSATTPLAGTEVLPVVQSGVTKQVSVANLTAGRNIATAAITSTVNTANGDGYQITNSNNSAYVTIQVNGATGSGVTNWANSAVIESVPASTGGLTLGSYTGDINFQTNFRTIAPLTLKQTGNVNVNSGNVVQGTAAKGFDFSANTPAAGKTSTLLNWYEEGTFTPTISGSTTAGTGTYVSQVGRYTRIGRQVSVYGRVRISAHTGTGNILISSLPFGLSGDYAVGNIMAANLALTASNYPVIFMSGTGSTSININQLPVGGGADTSVPMDTSCDLLFSITYFTS